jgi:hypothetical protein
MADEVKVYTADQIKALVLQMALIANFGHTTSFREVHLYQKLKDLFGGPEMGKTADMARDIITTLLDTAVSTAEWDRELQAQFGQWDLYKVVDKDVEELKGLREKVSEVIDFVFEKGYSDG